MDPNVALEMIRNAVNELKEEGYTEDGMVDDLIQPVEALDEWISKGGFLPKAWQGNPAIVIVQWDNGPAVFGPFSDLDTAANWITATVSARRKVYVLPMNMLRPDEYREWDNESEGE